MTIMITASQAGVSSFKGEIVAIHFIGKDGTTLDIYLADGVMDQLLKDIQEVKGDLNDRIHPPRVA